MRLSPFKLALVALTLGACGVTPLHRCDVDGCPPGQSCADVQGLWSCVTGLPNSASRIPASPTVAARPETWLAAGIA